MTTVSIPDDEDEFRTALGRLLLGAHRNGIDIECHWACRTAGDAPDWEVEVTPLVPAATPPDA